MPGVIAATLGAATYLHHEIDVAEPMDLPVALGGEDALMVWLNGERLFDHNGLGPFSPERHSTTLRLKPGKNQLLLKSCNHFGKSLVYICPRWPAKLESLFGENLKRDFPR
jgi:hypothetical protein